MDDLPYQPFYCEENVYRLCERERFASLETKVAFVSNERKRVAMWHQKPAGTELSLWDYHVVLLAHDGGWEIWDPSSTLGAPVPAATWLARTFGEAPVPPRFRPRFRVVDGAEFLSTFSSDRSHMRDEGGGFVKTPPPWPAIVRPGVDTNLTRFVDMRGAFVGDVMTLARLRTMVSSAPGRNERST